ncbi:biliverdin-producing heme oxygenase [Gluconobacter oxydans]|uniref:biliverdin-producing heme oxygenase n=1 Tax=Gluconobacter oxydans TaxID=442 RepID=UPI000A8CA929|nr:biliverdin-producing heme oxygenase [Gluconobacter oxydans]
METVGGADEQKNSGLTELRHVSRKAHEAVDEAFSRFELADPQSYGDFLTAHARVLGAAEAYLSRHAASLPVWRPRAALLKDDLRQMGLAVPAVQAECFPESDGTAMGVLYVLEGSRLGGRVLSGRLAEGLPRAICRRFTRRENGRRFLSGSGSIWMKAMQCVGRP